MTIPLLVWGVCAAFKNKQTPIPASVKTDLGTLPSKSHKYFEKARAAFHNLISHLPFAGPSVSLLKILQLAIT